MKILIISCLLAAAAGDVSHILKDEKQAAILEQTLDLAPDGAYQWEFQSDNGIRAEARGEIKNPNDENPSQVAQGSAKWTAPNGEEVSFQYVADEDGYHPQGSHIPTPPPIPPEIQRALAYLYKNAPPLVQEITKIN